MDTQPYRFTKVDDFFRDYRSWPFIRSLKSWSLASDKESLELVLTRSDGGEAGALIEFIQAGTARFRFNPAKRIGEYTQQNSRSIVMNTIDDLRLALRQRQPFTVEVAKDSTSSFAHVTARHDTSGTPKSVLDVRVESSPFRIIVTDAGDAEPHELLRTDNPCLYFSPNGDTDHHIVYSIHKPATARYVGFGEQGGKEFIKNTHQLNFFNFDNMRYRQVYNHGPLDNREPLYHSDPFFVELNGNPGMDCVIGLFVDNPAQIFVDIGYLNSSRHMIGTRFGDLDVYLMAGHNAAEVLHSFIRLVGHSRLKPRYALGYHQGCYGSRTGRMCMQR